MNTTHTPESRLNTYLDMYTHPANTAGEIARIAGILPEVIRRSRG